MQYSILPVSLDVISELIRLDREASEHQPVSKDVNQDACQSVQGGRAGGARVSHTWYTKSIIRRLGINVDATDEDYCSVSLSDRDRVMHRLRLAIN